MIKFRPVRWQRVEMKMDIKGNEIARLFLGKTERHGSVVNVCYAVTVDGYPMEYVEGEHDQELIRLTREFAETNDAVRSNGHVDFTALRDKGLYEVVEEKFQVDRQAFEQAERYYRDGTDKEVLVHDLTYGIANQYYKDMVNKNRTWWLSPSGLELSTVAREKEAFSNPYHGSGATYLAAVSKISEYKKNDVETYQSIDHACDELVENNEMLKGQIDQWYRNKESMKAFEDDLLFRDVMTIFEKREEKSQEKEEEVPKSFRYLIDNHFPEVTYVGTRFIPLMKEKLSLIKQAAPSVGKGVVTVVKAPFALVGGVASKVSNLAYSGPPKFNWWEEHKLERDRKYVIKRDKKKKFHKAWDGTIHKLKVGASIVALATLLGYCSSVHANAMAAPSKEERDFKPSSSSSCDDDISKLKENSFLDFTKSKEYQETLVNRVMATLEQGANLMAQSTQGHVK